MYVELKNELDVDLLQWIEDLLLYSRCGSQIKNIST